MTASIDVSANLDLALVGLHVDDLGEEIQNTIREGVANILDLDSATVSATGITAIDLGGTLDDVLANGTQSYMGRRRLGEGSQPCGYLTFPTSNTVANGSSSDHSQLSMHIDGYEDSTGLLAATDFIQTLIDQMATTAGVQQVDSGPTDCERDTEASATVTVTTAAAQAALSSGAYSVVQNLLNASKMSVKGVRHVLQVPTSAIERWQTSFGQPHPRLQPLWSCGWRCTV